MSKMRIISATVENFKRIEVVEITAAGDVVEISGGNEQGKSSVLDSIEAALGGKRHQPKEPIRRGEESARVVVDLGEIIVERVWTAKTDRLVVRSPEGAIYPKGQTKLDEFIDALAFDALTFMSRSAKEQREVLLRLIGVDLDSIETRKSEAFEARRLAGQQLRAAQARIEGMPEPDDGPTKLVDVSALNAELTEARRVATENDRARRAAERIASEADLAEERAADFEAEVVELREKIEALKRQLAEDETEQAKVMAEAKDARAKARKAEASAAKLKDPDLDAIQSRMAAADEINAAARERIRRAEERTIASDVVEKHGRNVAAAQSALDKIEAEKAAALADAKMPVEGLGITDDGVTYEGIPLEQASMSRRVRVCTAIGAALNPKLRIALVRHGNDLDDNAIRQFYAYCKEHDLQPWVERISPTQENAIVIEAGRVAS